MATCNVCRKVFSRICYCRSIVTEFDRPSFIPPDVDWAEDYADMRPVDWQEMLNPDEGDKG